MRKMLMRVGWSIAGAVLAILLQTGPAHALSQWARKYDMSCQTCHTAFPRLNYFGEQFKRNGYQLPGTADGDETKKQVGDNNLFIDKIGNLFGIRVNITPIKLETNRLTTNGTPKTRVSFGNPNWVQFFTGGSVFKNASIFIEAELENTEVVLNWFTAGYHNLFKTPLLNVRLGKLSPTENFSQSGRVRMIPSLRIEGISGIVSGGGYSAAAQAAAAGPAAAGVTAANSTHDDAVPLASPQPSVEIFGYKGPFLYSVGVTNGSSLVDTNKYKNLFGTLRAELQEGALAGSNVSGWGYVGWDTADNTRFRQTDRFWRTAGGANLRWKDLDVLAAFIYGKDNNWDLLTGIDQTSKAITTQVGYLIGEKWFTALQYDWVRGTDASDNFNKVSPVLTFMPRQNMRIDMGGRLDIRNTAGGRQHEMFANVRMMF